MYGLHGTSEFNLRLSCTSPCLDPTRLGCGTSRFSERSSPSRSLRSPVCEEETCLLFVFAVQRPPDQSADGVPSVPLDPYPLRPLIRVWPSWPCAPWVRGLGFFMVNDSLCPRNTFRTMRKTCKTVIHLYVACPGARAVFMRVHFVDLRSRRTLGRYLGTFKVAIYFGVGELLGLDDLKLPILLDKREDKGTIGGERGAIGRARGCGLHHS